MSEKKNQKAAAASPKHLFMFKVNHTSLFNKLRDVFKATNFFAISSSGSFSPFALVPTSSLFLTLTDRLSSSSWPTTI